MKSIYVVWEFDGNGKDIYLEDEKTAERIKNALSVGYEGNSYGTEKIDMEDPNSFYAVYKVISCCFTTKIYEVEIVNKPVKNNTWDEFGDVGGEICIPLSSFGDTPEEIKERVIEEFKELKEEFLKNKAR